MIPVILSGGSGSRLWPLSRQLHPKQFLPLVGDRTMVQITALRAAGCDGAGRPLVVCNEAHRFLVAEQLRLAGVEPGAILLEPVARNTAPAIAVAACEALSQDRNPLLLVLPADHAIRNEERFAEAVVRARRSAEEGALVTFGVVPDRPETGYGYIRCGDPVPGGDGACRVAAFAEKPDRAAAEAYCAAGDYLWNSGMFLFRASCYLEELRRFVPEMAEATRRAHGNARRDLDFLRLDSDAFAESPADSIDYAVMERTDRAVVVPLDAGWSDVGSWAALQEADARDGDGNVLHGDVLAIDSRNCYLRSEERLVATVGLEDHVVVETADAVLVAHRDRVQEVKRIVERLDELGRDEASNHRRVYRPWGSYECISLGDRFQVKRIVVKPGERLSTQMHHHRAEHWVVVRGTARVTCGEAVNMVSENESTYIPLGTRHCLENPGRIPLELIEVQSGSYLGEDDIIRFSDLYGRD